MEDIFISIMERIASILPDVPSVDEDYGQLEMGIDEDSYPVTFPCILIGNADTDWDDIGGGAQRGASLVTVRLAVDCYHDTSLASGTYVEARERMKLANRVYTALQGFECTDNSSGLVRVKSRSFALPHYIKVYEATFSFYVHDESAMESS